MNIIPPIQKHIPNTVRGSFFGNLSITQKLGLGLGVLAFLTLVVITLCMFNGWRVLGKIEVIEERYMPAALISARAQANLLHMIADLRGYLVLSDIEHLDKFNQAKIIFEHELGLLENLASHWHDQENIQIIQEVKETAADWTILVEKLFILHDKPLQNQPALKISRLGVRALNIKVLANIAQLIELQKQQSNTGSNTYREQLSNMIDFRTSFDSMLVNLRAYAASRDVTFKSSYNTYLSFNAAAWGKLDRAAISFTAEQQQIIQSIAVSRETILNTAFQIFEAVEGERVYEDLYLFRSEANPRAEHMLNLLKQLTLTQQSALENDLDLARKNMNLSHQRLLISGFITFLLALVMAYVFKQHIAGPVLRLSSVVTRIRQGERFARATVESRDEIGQLAMSFNAMTEQLNQMYNSLWGEMQLAAKIQTVLLPSKPELPGYEIAASLEPADEVGGDYYDVISVGGYNWLVVGDVSGHGVTSGLVMMMVQTAIHTVLLENPNVEPCHLISMLNRMICTNLEKMGDSKHMTIVVLASITDGHFSFAGHHEDILIWRTHTGQVERVETTGMWIGIMPDISDMLHEDMLKLELGDCMVLFTDGITEARDINNNLFGDDRLVKVIEESGNVSAAQVHANILASLQTWNKRDDVTLMVLKRTE